MHNDLDDAETHKAGILIGDYLDILNKTG